MLSNTPQGTFKRKKVMDNGLEGCSKDYRWSMVVARSSVGKEDVSNPISSPVSPTRMILTSSGTRDKSEKVSAKVWDRLCIVSPVSTDKNP